MRASQARKTLAGELDLELNFWRLQMSAASATARASAEIEALRAFAREPDLAMPRKIEQVLPEWTRPSASNRTSGPQQ
jgi:hypothetical protein